MQLDGKAIWVTWHEHRRTRSLVERLGVECFVFDDHRPFQRNVFGPLWTLWVLLRERPQVVYLHFSYLLQAVVYLYKYLFRFGRLTVVADCHNKALKRSLDDGPVGGLFTWFKRTIFRAADLVVVTNDVLVEYGRRWCPEVAVLRDPLVDWHGEDEAVRATAGYDGRRYIIFVCSFDKDEPVELILDAAREIPERFDRDVYVTGNASRIRLPDDVANHDRIRFLGFVPIQDYKRNLFLADVVVVLTNDDDCLVCGAYEALGARSALVLSATDALVGCFGEAVHFARHEVEDLLEAIDDALNATGPRSEDLKAFERAFDAEWSRFESQVRQVARRD